VGDCLVRTVCINTVVSPDNGHSRPKHVEIDNHKYIKKKIVHQVGLIYKNKKGILVYGARNLS